MDEIWLWALLIAATLAASCLSAVTGFGGAAILLPILVVAFGVRDAIPILAVAQLIGNGSRVWFNHSEIHYPVVKWFLVGSVPAAIFGGFLFASAPLSTLTRLLGVFLIAIVIAKHIATGKLPKMRLRWFAPLGAISSFISALIGTAGPLIAPFFLAFGLVKGAYIGTEALSALLMHASKLIAYGGGDALSLRAIYIGMMLGPMLIVGTYLGKRLVNHLPERFFKCIVDIAIVVVGLAFLVGGQ